MERYNSYGYGDSIDAINQQLDALECSRCPAPAPVAPVAAAGGDAKDAEIAALRAELAALKAPAAAKQVEPSNFEPNPASALSLDLTVPLSVIIFGATGDLAKKKLFPALYQLILLGHFPRRVNIVGYGRRAVDLDDFIAKQCVNIKEQPGLPYADFIKMISFHAGGYDSDESYSQLNNELCAFEDALPGPSGNRLYFLSIPPFVFGDVTIGLGAHCRAREGGFTHLIIEKPFGSDSKTFDELNKCTSSTFKESELFRIDHYLGKEVVLNLSTMRFANQIFEPIWNRDHIESIEITFKEDIGTGGRGGYFDKFGIIRDIMQNHLLQVFMFCAIEPPQSMTAEGLAAAKVALLSAVDTLSLDDGGAFLGQFSKNTWNLGGVEHTEDGYGDDPTVPEGSECPTFAAVVLKVNNDRWSGVPFLMKAGKGLDERMAEVRVRFKPKAFNALMQAGGIQLPGNELVMRIQPDEALYLKTFSKEPGLGSVTKPTVMDMKYSTAFEGSYVGDAYERMFFNAARGDGSLFVGEDELIEAWRIFTPLLHQIDEQKPQVVKYPFGMRVPPGFDEWSIAQAGIAQQQNWQDFLATHADSCEALAALFDKLDVNGNGFLTPSEVLELAKQFYDGREPTEKKINQIISMMDHDGDGQVSRDELLRNAGCLQNAFGQAANSF